MKKILVLFALFLILFLTVGKSAYAIEDPFSHPNNKIGVHILFPSEVQNAAKLVDSNGGDWGYVIIPIQSGDKDLKKWQSFMNDCKKLHIIPIIRLATEGDYFNTTVWRKPELSDVLDFSNFLSSLDWPVKNRYVVVYNEVNRGDEWGGLPDPNDYAQLLSYAVTLFKEKSPDFFLISAGMDNAAPTSGIFINEYTFLSQMNQAVPGIFNQVDGIASHSYPNPGFSQPPSVISRMSISSFTFEKALIDKISSKSLPVFITETGWSQDVIGTQKAAQYLLQALTTTWNNPNIVAITPFLLQAGAGPFHTFSFLDGNGSQTPEYNALFSYSKTKGQPTIDKSVLAADTQLALVPTEKFDMYHPDTRAIHIAVDLKQVFKWFLGMP